MLIIDKPELTRMILSQVLEKLPSTRNKGEGYYIAEILINGYVHDIITNFRHANTLEWGTFEYALAVGDRKRYEIARVIVDHYMHELRYVGNGRRLAKNGKEQFVADIITDFHKYGFFNQSKKELAYKVAQILTSEDVTNNN